ncbi:MAG: hypothetical protein EXS55_04880 [Candidatus Magasanikbacteria bacterium]|nr:hypothetical protein [Candidatus Magasanikbacteria bacterium]
MSEKFRSFVKFLADNANGLVVSTSTARGIKPISYAMARLAILRLVDRLSCKKLVRRCRHRKWGNDLLRTLSAYFHGKQRWLEFVRAVVLNPVKVWGRYFSVLVAQEILDQEDMMDLIIKEVPDVLDSDNDHPLFECFQPDQYWAKLVHRHIAKRDWRRAYEETKKASKGMRIRQPNIQKGDRPFDDNIPRRFPATKRMVARLIGELFSAMVKKRTLKSMPEGNFSLDSRYAKVKVYDTKNNGRRPRVCEKSEFVAGFEFARMFLVQEATGSRWDTNRTPDIFLPEGGMIMAIAAHVAKGKNEVRRRRHEKVLREYERSQQQGS